MLQSAPPLGEASEARPRREDSGRATTHRLSLPGPIIGQRNSTREKHRLSGGAAGAGTTRSATRGWRRVADQGDLSAQDGVLVPQDRQCSVLAQVVPQQHGGQAGRQRASRYKVDSSSIRR